MGYPPQQPGPYGQNQPNQPYGYTSGPQPQYGYQPPTGPPPPPRRNNTVLILMLAIGLPLLLLGGCAALVMTLGSDSRDRLVTEPDLSNLPIPKSAEASPPPAEPQESAQAQESAEAQQPAAATVGQAITLQGFEGLQMEVTLAKLVSKATGDQFSKPKDGNRFVAVQVTLKNVGQKVYSDSPSNGALLIDGEGQQYRSTLHSVQEGQSFGGTATISAGDSRKGMIVFEVPEGAKLAKLQFGLNSGFADQKGEWSLG
ncbi:DUF4352 domain-containing protein [Nonomuraea bangladeshensis]|uniref:DUF4352 domain-containing protein n=1 Tax=Nonomuraea bangladeshensis TaxID=404385 RepID=A0ABV3H490_9ACTN